MPRALAIVALALALSALGAPGPGGAQTPAALSTFAEGFEGDTGWKVFEELVGGSPCYAAGIGEVARTTDYVFAGAYGLNVWANRSLAAKSNHLIAYTAFEPADARAIWRYRVRLLVPAASQGRGQVGPELSLQNTRPDGAGGWATATAGVQYLANPHLADASGWHIWAETAPGQAGWRDIARAPITPGAWYTATLDVDYGANRYLSFELEGPGTRVHTPLGGFAVAEERKGFAEPAFVLTLESENIWNTCEPVPAYDYRVVYDQVEVMTLRRLALPLVLAGP